MNDRNEILKNFKSETPSSTVDIHEKTERLQQSDNDTWPDGWGRTGRHATFALQLIQRQKDNSAKTTAVIYGSICSDIKLETDNTLESITFVYETHEGLFKVTITGKDLNESFDIGGKQFNSVYDQVCEAKRTSIRENPKFIERIDIEKLEEKEEK